QKKSGRLPRLARGAGLERRLPRFGHPLEVDALGLADPPHPAALAGMEELGPSLGHEGLPGRSLGGYALGRRSERLGGLGQGRGSGGGGRGGLEGGRVWGWGRRVDLVDLEIGADRRLELGARLLELAHGATERSAELGQVLRSEDKERDHEDEDELLETDVE